eukprot:8009782-Alexandrium_andersonii.AAC.1
MDAGSTGGLSSGHACGGGAGGGVSGGGGGRPTSRSRSPPLLICNLPEAFRKGPPPYPIRTTTTATMGTCSHRIVWSPRLQESLLPYASLPTGPPAKRG